MGFLFEFLFMFFAATSPGAPHEPPPNLCPDGTTYPCIVD